MARTLQGRLEEEADRNGLEGERRKEYIGGAWNRIRGVEHHSRWRHSQESALLARHFGIIHEFRESKDGRSVIFRQGRRQWTTGEREVLCAAMRLATMHQTDEAAHNPPREAGAGSDGQPTRENGGQLTYEDARRHLEHDAQAFVGRLRTLPPERLPATGLVPQATSQQSPVTSSSPTPRDRK